MIKTNIKTWFKKSLIAIFVASTILSVSTPVLSAELGINNVKVAYAADPAPAATPAAKPAAAETAAAPAQTADASKQIDDTLKNSVAFMISLEKVLNKLLWPVLVLIGGLLDNSILFGSGMEERLREIWVPVRNLVNILFVIALLGIALYNVLGLGDESGNYSIKSILPKIIVGIIVVNFSFVGIKVFLDSINVLTTSIFALPDQVDEGLSSILDPKTPEDYDKVARFCKSYQGKSPGEKISDETLRGEAETVIYRELSKKYASDSLKGSNVALSPNDSKAVMKTKVYDKLSASAKVRFDGEFTERKNSLICDGTVLGTQGKLFLQKYNSRNASLAMALNMTNILFYDDISLGVDTVEKFAINTIFSLALYLIYVASFIALFVVLLARLVVMWVSIALSPVLLLGLAVPVIKEKISSFGEVTDQFMQNAIAPLGIAVSMTIGWIMLSALKSINTFDTVNAIYFNSASGIPVVGVSTLQELIVALGTVAVIWMAVFTAASKSIAAPVTEAIKGGLQSAGKWVGTTPLRNMPMFPITIAGKSQDYTANQVLDALGHLSQDQHRQDLTNRILNRSEDFGTAGLFRNPPATADDFMKKVLEANRDRKVVGLDPETMKALKDFRNNDNYRGLKMNSTAEGARIEKAIDTALAGFDSSDESVRKDAAKAAQEAVNLMRNHLLGKGINPDAPNTPASNPSNASAVNAGTSWGGQRLNQRFNGRTNQMNAAIQAINNAMTKLDKATTVPEAEAAIREIANTPGGATVTADEIKNANAAAFNKAESLLGKGGVDATLNTARTTPTTTP